MDFSFRTAHRQTSRPSMNSASRDPPVQSRPYDVFFFNISQYRKNTFIDQSFHGIKLIHLCHPLHVEHQRVLHVNRLFSKII